MGFRANSHSQMEREETHPDGGSWAVWRLRQSFVPSHFQGMYHLQMEQMETQAMGNTQRQENRNGDEVTV